MLCAPNSGDLLFSNRPRLFISPLTGELVSLRGDMGQMDFGALDYSNDRRGQAEKCC